MSSSLYRDIRDLRFDLRDTIERSRPDELNAKMVAASNQIAAVAETMATTPRQTAAAFHAATELIATSAIGQMREALEQQRRVEIELYKRLEAIEARMQEESCSK